MCEEKQGITDVVRGDDLLASAARQQLLYRAFARPSPRWWHLPLVFDDEGNRLAKRRDDLSLESLRAAGVRRERVLGLLARWCGFVSERVELDKDGFRSLVSPATLRAMTAREHALGGRRTMHEEDRRWLSST